MFRDRPDGTQQYNLIEKKPVPERGSPPVVARPMQIPRQSTIKLSRQSVDGCQVYVLAYTPSSEEMIGSMTGSSMSGSVTSNTSGSLNSAIASIMEAANNSHSVAEEMIDDAATSSSATESLFASSATDSLLASSATDSMTSSVTKYYKVRVVSYYFGFYIQFVANNKRVYFYTNDSPPGGDDLAIQLKGETPFKQAFCLSSEDAIRFNNILPQIALTASVSTHNDKPERSLAKEGKEDDVLLMQEDLRPTGINFFIEIRKSPLTHHHSYQLGFLDHDRKLVEKTVYFHKGYLTKLGESHYIFEWEPGQFIGIYTVRPDESKHLLSGSLQIIAKRKRKTQCIENGRTIVTMECTVNVRRSSEQAVKTLFDTRRLDGQKVPTENLGIDDKKSTKIPSSRRLAWSSLLIAAIGIIFFSGNSIAAHNNSVYNHSSFHKGVSHHQAVIILCLGFLFVGLLIFQALRKGSRSNDKLPEEDNGYVLLNESPESKSPCF